MFLFSGERESGGARTGSGVVETRGICCTTSILLVEFIIFCFLKGGRTLSYS